MTYVSVGQKIQTRIGAAVVESREWVAGSGSKRKMVFKIRWESTGLITTVSRRKLSSMIVEGSPVPAPAPSDAAPKPTPAPVDIGGKSLAEVIADVVGPYVKGNIDRDEVVRIVDERVSQSILPRRVEVITLEGDVKDMGIQHTHFDAICRLAALRLNIWIVGPAGGGKTSIGSAIAERFDLPFYQTSVCQTTTKSDLIGYKNATTGEYVRTDLREAYENGGVFLLDEIDGGNPNTMVVMNSLMANTKCSFPDKMVEKHKDFIMCAGANTIGLGADRDYVGRNQLDKATLDRFVMMPFPYDPSIEAAMCGVPTECFTDSPRPEAIKFCDTTDSASVEARCCEYVKKVVAIRNVLPKLGVRHVISPRATKAGCMMIRVGFSVEDTLNMAVWKGLDEGSVKKVMAAC